MLYTKVKLEFAPDALVPIPVLLYIRTRVSSDLFILTIIFESPRMVVDSS